MEERLSDFPISKEKKKNHPKRKERTRWEKKMKRFLFK